MESGEVTPVSVVSDEEHDDERPIVRRAEATYHRDGDFVELAIEVSLSIFCL